MGFFGKLFEKKECSICGDEIGLLGNRKLEDGNCCKTCAGKLSPWFDDRRHSTVAQIREQLAWREENRRQLDTFRPVKNYGEEYELKAELRDGVPSRFVVARTRNYLEENADLLSFKDVTSFNIEIEEDRQELKRENKDGEMVSYVPPRYEYSYDFYAEIFTTNSYCDDIRFRLNDSTLNLETTHAGMIRPGGGHPSLSALRGNNREFDPNLYPEYRRYKALCDEVEALFRAGMEGKPLDGCVPVEAPAPVAEPAAAPGPRFCASCGAKAEGGKFCQYCGSAL